MEALAAAAAGTGSDGQVLQCDKCALLDSCWVETNQGIRDYNSTPPPVRPVEWIVTTRPTKLSNNAQWRVLRALDDRGTSGALGQLQLSFPPRHPV